MNMATLITARTGLRGCGHAGCWPHLTWFDRQTYACSDEVHRALAGILVGLSAIHLEIGVELEVLRAGIGLLVAFAGITRVTSISFAVSSCSD